jgi:hypothetical protein
MVGARISRLTSALGLCREEKDSFLAEHLCAAVYSDVLGLMKLFVSRWSAYGGRESDWQEELQEYECCLCGVALKTDDLDVSEVM